MFAHSHCYLSYAPDLYLIRPLFCRHSFKHAQIAVCPLESRKAGVYLVPGTVHRLVGKSTVVVLVLHYSSTKSHFSKMSHFRKLLLLALLGLFLWQTVMAASKFFRFGVAVTFEETYPPTQKFPSISFCPILVNRSYGEDNPFVPTPMINFIYGYEHGDNGLCVYCCW